MNIRIRYENQVTTIQVPEDDFTVMVETDYQERRAAAEDPSSVERRTPQEILDTEMPRAIWISGTTSSTAATKASCGR